MERELIERRALKPFVSELVKVDTFNGRFWNYVEATVSMLQGVTIQNTWL